ncbi:MAG: GNAT family N-acetyltransferase [Bacteroidales bacterium]|nr:GNAT family N-acetyltransferase [Bacteroidales bacterium]
MIKYLKHNEIDTDKWDHTINKAINGTIYGFSWYLDVVAGEWDALVMGDYESVFPLVPGKKMNIGYLYQPPFTQHLGIFSSQLLNTETIDAFLQQIPPEYRLIQINLNKFNKIDQQKYNVDLYTNHELDLIDPYRKIAEAYSKNTKRNIKKADKSGVTVFKNIKPEPVIELFKANKGRNIPNMGSDEYFKLRHLVYVCLYRGRALLYGAYTDKNELCTGAIFLRSHNRLIFLFSGNNDDAKRSGAMPRLIDQVISDHANSETILDFEGSNNPNLARFYKGFGSSVTHYYHWECNTLPWHIWQLIRAVKGIKHFKRQLIG